MNYQTRLSILQLLLTQTRLFAATLLPIVVVSGCRDRSAPISDPGVANSPLETVEQLDNLDDALPKGAMVRLGTSRSVSNILEFRLWTPECKCFLLSGPRLGDIPHAYDLMTGTVTRLPKIEKPDDATTGNGDGNFFALSADGKRAVTGQSASYAVWQLETGRVIARVKPTGYMALLEAPCEYPVSLSANGRILAFADRIYGPDKRIRVDVVVWDVDNNKRLAQVTTLQNGNVHLALSPDGKTLATFGFHFPTQAVATDGIKPGEALQLWDVASGKLLATLAKAFPENTGGMAQFSPDGKMLATSTKGGGPIQLWEVASGKLTDHQPQLSGQLMAFASDGKTLAAVDIKGEIRRWSLVEMRSLKPIPFPRPELISWPRVLRIAGLSFSNKERVVAWGTLMNRGVAWEAPSGKLLTPLGEHVAELRGLQFAAGGREVITNGVDNRIVRWDARTGKPLGSIEPPLHYIGLEAKLGIIDSALIDLTTGKESYRLPIRPAAVSADFSLVAGHRVTRDGKTLRVVPEVWDLKTRRKVTVLELPPKVELDRPNGGFAMAFSPDGTRLAMAARMPMSEGVAPLLVTGWDVKSGKKLGEFTKRSGTGSIRVVTADNTSCVIATEEGSLWTADYASGRNGSLIAQTPRQWPVPAPTFSPDGKLLAWPTQMEKPGWYGVRVYDWPSGKAVHTFGGHRAPVNVIAFSPDGKTLASGSQDTTVLLWDLSTIGK